MCYPCSGAKSSIRFAKNLTGFDKIFHWFAKIQNITSELPKYLIRFAKICYRICQISWSESIWCDENCQCCPTLDQGRFNATGSKAAKVQCHKWGILPIFAARISYRILLQIEKYLIGTGKIAFLEYLIKFDFRWRIIWLKLAKHFIGFA